MSCCGRSSGSAVRGAHSFRSGNIGLLSKTSPQYAYFRAAGPSSITAAGPISGRIYRFPSSGGIVPVDIRDAPSLARVPHLQAVRPR
jgi:hypothetical protein